MSTLYTLTHAFLWSLMEVETEGKRGWMYDSQTQCSGFLTFTWYHIVMNFIAMLTVTLIVRPSLVDKTPEEKKRTLIEWLYNLLLWFVVEDVGWFMVNGMTYRTAPWQSTTTAIISTVMPLGLVVYMYLNDYNRSYVWDFALVPVLIYIWAPFGNPFDTKEPYAPRNNYCN